MANVQNPVITPKTAVVTSVKQKVITSGISLELNQPVMIDGYDKRTNSRVTRSFANVALLLQWAATHADAHNYEIEYVRTSATF